MRFQPDTDEPAVGCSSDTGGDVKGPFTKKIPPDLEQQATLPDLGYTTALEKLSERFHIAPVALRRMNPRSRFVAGEKIKVPAVTPFDPAAKSTKDVEVGDITIQVSRDESALRATRSDGTLVFLRPCRAAACDRCLPAAGRWSRSAGTRYFTTIRISSGMPHDAVEGDDQGRPEQSRWRRVDRLNLEHYGLHGT
jgi:hypothetical protein